MDISVGPMRVEIIEPLEKLRVIVEPNDADIAMDVTRTASIPAFEEPRQYLRSRGTVVFDTQRFAQMGRGEGTLTVAGEDIAVTADRCGGSRDRCGDQGTDYVPFRRCPSDIYASILGRGRN